MNLRDFRLLTDENIHPTVTAFLRSQGFNGLDAKEEGLIGTDVPSCFVGRGRNSGLS